MKVLLLNSGLMHQGLLFADALSKYCEVFYAEHGTMTPYSLGKNFSHIKRLNETDVKDIDFVLGSDHGLILGLKKCIDAKIFPKAKIGCQILDYPEHILDPAKPEFNEWSSVRWKKWINLIEKMDFNIVNKVHARKALDYKLKLKPNLFVLYPAYGIKQKKESDGDFILYSGRVDMDRRINLIIDAIAKTRHKPPLKIVTSSVVVNFSVYAKEKGVSYEIIRNISEDAKFNIIANSRFIISAHYSYAPAGIICQANCLGKNSLIYDTGPDELEYFGKDVVYADNDFNKFVELIDKMWEDKEFRDKGKENRKKYFDDVNSYEAWGNKVYNFLRTL